MQYGGLDVLINNAGIAGGANIEDTSLELWERNIDILATGYFLFAREAVKVFKQQGTGGTMVFVASKNSIAPGKGATAYSSAKAAELHLARSPRRRAWRRWNPRQLRAAGRRDSRQQYLEHGVEGSARQAVRRQRGRTRRTLSPAQRPQGRNPA
ncbi:MAG: SDR family NAD(P)-dependent oxidoreductase [Chloroflexi bacterium]|nr:SDR family NAD(P)-dependent oxidoreductase [Chloroflexota bacterium]